MCSLLIFSPRMLEDTQARLPGKSSISFYRQICKLLRRMIAAILYSEHSKIMRGNILTWIFQFLDAICDTVTATSRFTEIKLEIIDLLDYFLHGARLLLGIFEDGNYMPAGHLKAWRNQP